MQALLCLTVLSSLCQFCFVFIGAVAAGHPANPYLLETFMPTVGSDSQDNGS